MSNKFELVESGDYDHGTFKPDPPRISFPDPVPEMRRQLADVRTFVNEMLDNLWCEYPSVIERYQAEFKKILGEDDE